MKYALLALLLTGCATAPSHKEFSESDKRLIAACHQLSYSSHECYELFKLKREKENPPVKQVDLSPLNFLATQWNAPQTSSPRAPICTTLSHYDGYGKLVTESSCQ